MYTSVSYTHLDVYKRQVSVRVRQLAGKVRGCGQYEFRIKDNGIGMSQEFAQKIFEPCLLYTSRCV